VVVAALAVAVGYVLGTLPTAVIVGRHAGHDPLQEGSHNPGATNVYRTAGRRAGAVVLAGDVLKGAVAAGLGWAAAGHLTGTLTGAAAVVGHIFPLRRPLHGGKGVATCAGMILVLFPVVGAAAAVLWIALARLSRRPSVASLALAVGIPVGVAVSGARGVEVAVVIALAVIVVLRHHANIARLAHGTERAVDAGQS
jgi:glycerol-3-phosphate acyltransferase PlsY